VPHVRRLVATMNRPTTAKMTPKQAEALRRAISNGGTLEIGGLDGDPVRRDVLIRLFKMGFVKYDGIVGYHNWVGVWRITDAGRAAIMELSNG
jgi:hypothetical protein